MLQNVPGASAANFFRYFTIVSGYGTVAVMALAIAVAVFLFALIAAFSTRLHIAPALPERASAA
ncbi:hypothetical protein [Pseudarthrobacter sp. SSS035]|uniref:hypothetical protein n=1 Tax=Pseudarthrobacter sp. SSS035 TaxID=2931399 RepID=UPI00200E4C1F|nr:hypothetical protein [Pseudarthrobacter sp. SSS035]